MRLDAVGRHLESLGRLLYDDLESMRDELQAFLEETERGESRERMEAELDTLEEEIDVLGRRVEETGDHVSSELRTRVRELRADHARLEESLSEMGEATVNNFSQARARLAEDLANLAYRVGLTARRLERASGSGGTRR